MNLPSGATIIEGMRRYADRDIIRVRLPLTNLIQPFYRSTGQNSGMAARWLPFDGLLLQGANDFWFNKGRFTGDRVKDDLQRFGTGLLKQISDELGQVPELAHFAGKDAAPTDINSWLGTHSGASHNATNAGENPLKGAPSTLPGTPITPKPPTTQDFSSPASGNPNGASGANTLQSAPQAPAPQAPAPDNSNNKAPKPPLIHTVRPLKAVPGAQIRLSGTRLDLVSEVSIGGVPAPIFSQDRALLIVPVPANATFGATKVEAKWAGGSIAAPGTFTVAQPEEEKESEESAEPDAPTPTPNEPRSPSANGHGFWQTLLTDPDVRRAVHESAPRSLRPFISPLMEKGAQMLGGSEGAMSGAMGQAVGLMGGGAGGFVAGRAAGTSGILAGAGGLAGGALAGPLGAALGSAIGTVVEKAIGTAIENVHEMRGLGERSVDNVMRGALSAADKAMGVGLQIGETLLRGALKPFGASGSALAGFAGTVGQSVKGVLGAGLGLAAGGLKTVGGLAAGGAGVALGVGGAMYGMMMGGPLFAVVGAVVGTTVGKMLMSAVSAVTGVIGGVFDALGKAVGELGRVGGAALSTLLSVMDDVKNAAMGMSKSILDISQQSGMSIGASSAAVNNLQGFGINPQMASQMLSKNTLFAQAQDAGWGIHGDMGSAQNLRETRAEYQKLLAQGHGNPLIANTMMQQTGKEALIPMANLPRGVFERSLSNGAGLGMGTEAVLKWQQDFGLMQNDLGRFAEYVKVTLGNAFLPAFQKGLGIAVEFFKTNKEEIIGGIKAIGRWFYADLPSMVLEGAISVVGTFGSITKGLANMIRGFSDGKGALHDWVHSFLGGLDKVITGVNGVVHGFQTFAAYAKAAAEVASHPLDFKKNAQALARARKVGAQPVMESHMAQAFDKATARKYDKSGNPIPTAMDKATGWLDDRSRGADGLRAALEARRPEFNRVQNGQGFDRLFAGMQEQKDALQTIADNTGRKLDVNAKISMEVDAKSDFYAKVLANETWASWTALGAAGA